MTSSQHEALVELFRERPSLAVELLVSGLGKDPPAHERVRLEGADLPTLVPAEFRADAVVALHRDDVPVHALVVEVQLNRDPDKRLSWPCYVANLRSRLGCPVDVLVLAPKRPIARWCREPIPLGVSGSVVMPLVIGPEQIPVVTDPAEAVGDPELAVLSALVHGGDPEHEAVLVGLTEALRAVEYEHGILYLELVHRALPAAARRYLEALMTITPIDPLRSEIGRIVFARAINEGRERGLAEGRERGLAEGRERGLAEGKAEGKSAAVLAVLDARGVAVPDGHRQRIQESTDLDGLDAWLRRAATLTEIDELFA